VDQNDDVNTEIPMDERINKFVNEVRELKNMQEQEVKKDKLDQLDQLKRQNYQNKKPIETKYPSRLKKDSSTKSITNNLNP